MTESAFDRLIRFSNAIANDIPDDEGDEWGPELVAFYGEDLEGLLDHVREWLIRVGFEEEDSRSCISLATMIAFKIAYSTEEAEWGQA